MVDLHLEPLIWRATASINDQGSGQMRNCLEFLLIFDSFSGIPKEFTFSPNPVDRWEFVLQVFVPYPRSLPTHVAFSPRIPRESEKSRIPGFPERLKWTPDKVLYHNSRHRDVSTRGREFLKNSIFLRIRGLLGIRSSANRTVPPFPLTSRGLSITVPGVV